MTRNRRLTPFPAFGDQSGQDAAVRAYCNNYSFTVNDAPHETRLEPHEWGEALVE